MHRPQSSAPPSRSNRPTLLQEPWLTGWLLFALALVFRLLFWRATPDAAWGWSAWYLGDAATWLARAGALLDGISFDLDLPIQPPGNTYLIAALWNGEISGIATLKFAWCVMGAVTVILIYLAVLRSFGQRAATFVGLVCAAASGLMILSTSLNNETPYLLLVAGSLVLWSDLWDRPRVPTVAVWSVIHAFACLVRAEHLLYFVLLFTVLVLRWLRAGGREGRRSTIGMAALSGILFVAVLTPWHLQAWGAIGRFNHEGVPPDSRIDAAQREIEQFVDYITWSPEAEAGLERLPAATRRTSRLFVAATEGIRGRDRVEAASLGILEGAFGSLPQPLPENPYLVLLGPLNFYLANNPGNRHGGFNRDPLDLPPPLTGGIDRYPLALVQSLPPDKLTLIYPPHLRAVNHGYRLGWEWIHRQPAAFLVLAGRKLANFWGGATLGFGGYGLPIGLAGVRRQVDLVVPDPTTPVRLWRLTLAALAVAGLWIGRKEPSLIPWAGLLFARLPVVLAFFGFARHGATVIPVIALLSWLTLVTVARRRTGGTSRPGRPGRRAFVGAWVIAALLLAIEVARWASPPEVVIDGRAVVAAEPGSGVDHRDRRIELR